MDSEQDKTEGKEMLPPTSTPAALKTSDDAVVEAKAFMKTIPDFADTLNENASDPVHPSKVEPVSETVVQGSKYAKELPITHLKNPVSKRVFEATPDLMSRKDLVPCDEDGKKVYDHRCL